MRRISVLYNGLELLVTSFSIRFVIMESTTSGVSGEATAYCIVCEKRVRFSEAQIHRLPSKPELRELWVDTLRKNNVVSDTWIPKSGTRICGKHFLPTDYGAKDSNKWRKPSPNPSKKPGLSRNAIPSVFKSYIPRPTNLSSAESRALKNHQNDEKMPNIVDDEKLSFDDPDEIKNIEDLISRLSHIKLPPDVQTIVQKEKVSFLKLSLDEKPTVDYCTTVKYNLTCEIWLKGEKMKIKDITGEKTATDEVRSIRLLEKVLTDLDENNTPDDNETRLKKIIEEIRGLGEEIGGTTVIRKLAFICEQLSLLLKHRNGRRYSKEFLAIACMWQTISPALYKQMLADNIITLPNHKYVRRLTGSITVENDLSEATIAYLKARIAKLEAKDMNINLILDEIYVQMMVQYINGILHGNENGEFTKTMLCIMIKSVAGKYEDIVSMVPIVNISSEKIFEVWTNVVKHVTALNFNVVATTADGHKSNMKFYKQHLCKGQLRPYIQNPFNLSNKIFLLFDPTHLLKCIYHNFRGKESFVCPKFADSGEILPNMYPMFDHIKKVHELEMGNPVKYAHKLSDKVINPLALEKTNVSLATAVFDESTTNALKHFSKLDGFQGMADTAEFLQIIKNWWDVLNVKSVFKGKHKRNKFMERIDKDNLEHVRSYFKQFSSWVKKWRTEYPDYGLSHPTFNALLQTTAAIMDLAEYLIESDNGIGYCLLGFLQQDVLESRFGWWRQLAGANYYCSTLQLLQAEKVIKLRNLVKDGYNLSDIQDIFKEAEYKKNAQLEQEAIHYCCSLGDFTFSENLSDVPIIYYVAGYICRQLINQTKCENCQELFSTNKEEIQVIIDDNGVNDDDLLAGKAFIDAISRGGLIKPSDLLHVVCMHASDLFRYIISDEVLKKDLLKSVNQRALFVEVFLDKMEEQESTYSILEIQCKEKHSFLKHTKHISVAMFNLFAKNFISECNSKIHASRKRTSKDQDEENTEPEEKKRDKCAMKAKKLQSR